MNILSDDCSEFDLQLWSKNYSIRESTDVMYRSCDNPIDINAKKVQRLKFLELKGTEE